MAIKRISTLVGAGDLGASVGFWTAVLGADPTFVDGQRWAQFDAAGGRVSLGAGAERPGATAVMISVDDLDAHLAALRAGGVDPGEVVAGPHERRVTLAGPGGETVILYQAI